MKMNINWRKVKDLKNCYKTKARKQFLKSNEDCEVTEDDKRMANVSPKNTLFVLTSKNTRSVRMHSGYRHTEEAAKETELIPTTASFMLHQASHLTTSSLLRLAVSVP